MSESDSHRVLVIGSDGQPVGYAEVPAQLSPGSGEGSDGGVRRTGRSTRRTPSASPPR